MRNSWNSWDNSDSWKSDFTDDGKCGFVIGQNDLSLMQKLIKAGTDHSKFMRMIDVSVDITAPLYWIAEHDTYKIGTVRNSCSFMHNGVTKPFEINDFSVQDERIYYLLNPIAKTTYDLIYPYTTDEFRFYELPNGRKYKVFRNGKIVACEFYYVDNFGSGRTRTFPERECKPSKTKSGYYEIHLGGKSGEKWLLHRLVATLWCDNPNNFDTVNHINGNKGDNSSENLEWCSREDNIKKGFESGLFEKHKLHLAYNSWKNGHIIVTPFEKSRIKSDYKNGQSKKDIKEKYGISDKTLNNILHIKPCENNDLFLSAYLWEKIIDNLNSLRELYLETKDENLFKEIRQLLPQGYNQKYTWHTNYQVLRNIYFARRNHRLNEWVDFCKWIEELPYGKELICIE